jgi:hypothetical protein
MLQRAEQPASGEGPGIDVPIDFVYAFVRQLAANSNGDLLYLASVAAAEETGTPQKAALEFAQQARSYGEAHSPWPKGFM